MQRGDGNGWNPVRALGVLQTEPGSPSPAPKSCVSHVRLPLFLACCNGKGARTSAVWGGGRDTPTSLFQPHSHPKETQHRSHTRALLVPVILGYSGQVPALTTGFRERQPSAVTKFSLADPLLNQASHRQLGHN